MRDDEPGSVRDAIGQSQHSAPAAGAVLRDQFETHEVFQRIVAGVIWLVYAVTDSLAQIVVYLSFLAISTADLFHVVSFTEVLCLVFLGEPRRRARRIRPAGAPGEYRRRRGAGDRREIFPDDRGAARHRTS
jgi:hypothetical protein